MADLSVTPVASQIKPVPGMSLGEMVNFARGAQEYQRGGISLTLEQQKEAERNRVMQFMSRPENFQSDGRIDINKLNAEIPKLAPLTGGDLIRQYSDLSTAQTQAERAIQDMTTSQREVIGSSLSAAGYMGVKDPNAYQGLLNNLEKQYQNNPSMKNLVQSFRTQLSMVSNPDLLPQLAISAANQVMNPSAQQAAFAPQAGTASTGAATYQTVTQPSVAGEAPKIMIGQTPIMTAQLPPGSREEFSGIYDLNNNPIINIKDANGMVVGQRVASQTPSPTQLPGATLPTPTGMGRPANIQAPNMQPSGAQTLSVQPVARVRPGETPETLKSANELRTSSMNAAQQVPLQTFNNNQIIKLADDVITGRGAQFVGALTGGYAALPFTTDNATNLNQLGHYMALQTASLANSSGLGGTDAARGIAGEISGTTSWTAPAIKQTARVNRALSTATDLFNQGVQNSFSKSNDPFAARDFQNRWSQTVDINAVRLYDAIRNNDKEAIQEVVKAAGGRDSAGYKRLVDNIGRMQQLIRGQ